MLGLTPDPLSAGVGMRVAVAGPYGHERVTAWQDGADAQRKNTAGGPFRLAEHARRTAPSPACPKRPFTTHADRRRPRLTKRTAPSLLDLRSAIHQLTPVRPRQFRGGADGAAHAPHPDFFSSAC